MSIHARRQAWKREIVAMLWLSLPLVLTNLAQLAMTITDVIFIGRLGSHALAAASLGANLYTAFVFFGLGLVTATAPMIARTLGERRHSVRDVRRTVQQGLWTVVLIFVPTSFLLWHGETLLLAIRQPPELAAMAGNYLRAMLWAMPSFLGYLVLRSFIAALQRPRWAFVVALTSIAFNVLGNWVLVFGHWGFEPMGLFGSGLATVLATLFLFLGMVLVILLDKQFRRYHLFGRFWQVDKARLAALWKLGIPIAITTTFEITIFNAAAFLMGWLGENELAAHTIAIQIVSAAFMIPYGIAQAVTIRVGYAHGAGNPQDVTRAGWSGFGLGISFMMLSASVMVMAPHTLISAFIDIHDQVNAAVLSLAISYLTIAAIFQIVDGAQVLGAGMLRGLHDTRIPMLYAAFGYWGVGLPSGTALAFWAGWRGVGIWSGLAIGLSVVSVLMVQRWMRRERVGLVKPHNVHTPGLDGRTRA
jgi:multidrug resistance protein, MATE family